MDVVSIIPHWRLNDNIGLASWANYSNATLPFSWEPYSMVFGAPKASITRRVTHPRKFWNFCVYLNFMIYYDSGSFLCLLDDRGLF